MKKLKPKANERAWASRASALLATDDLQLIRGIGPAIERRLHKAGIRTFVQLAALSPADVANVVAGLSVKRIIRQDWIGQARRLASKLAISPQHRATFDVELLLNEDDVVHHMRATYVQGKNKHSWYGWDERGLIDFVVRHAGVRLPLTRPATQPEAIGTALVGQTNTNKTLRPKMLPAASEAETPAPAQSPKLKADPRLDISNIRLAKPPGERQMDGQVFAKRMQAQINFELSGRAAHSVTAEQPRYYIHILVCELATGRATVLGTDQGQLRPERLSYATRVEFPLPRTGRYQLLGVVMLPEDDTVGATSGPVLNVVP